MRPERIDRYLDIGMLADQTDFLLPRLAWYWPEGGVAWLTEVPGKTVRRLIRKGDAPNPHLILEHLESLWSVATPPKDGRILQLERDYRFTKNVLGKLLVDTKIFDLLQKATHALEPFVEAWSPTGIAHNDFYNDQMLITPEGKLALVDFEEIGAGDLLLDVANFLAHLRWASHFNEGLEYCQS